MPNATRLLGFLLVLAPACSSPAAPATRSDTPAPVDTPTSPPDSTPAEDSEKPSPWTARPEDDVTPHQPIENIEALGGFLDRLAAVDDGEASLVRVVHLGASMLGDDDLTSVLRERFQTRFGDGGAGLVLLQRYMSNYRHLWVDLESRGWKNCFISYGCRKDGRYGLGGATFTSNGGASTTISTREAAPGNAASHLEVWYATEKRGGRLELAVDGQKTATIETSADTDEDRVHALDVELGAHTVTLTAKGPGPTRGYGIVLETGGPGVVWDQFSMLGAFTKHGLKWDPDHIAGQIEQRNPDLIAFTFGGNDLRRVAQGELDQAQYEKEYNGVVQRVRAGKPSASCLIIGITDRARSLSTTILPKHVEVIVSAQRQVAKENGCAFFDTYAAMGGGGSLKAWSKKSPPWAAKDLKHLTHEGRVEFAGWLYDGVIAGYVARRSKATP